MALGFMNRQKRGYVFIPTWLRRGILLATDILSWVLAVVIIAWLRFDFTLSALDERAILVFAVVAVVVQAVAGLASKHYMNRYWIASFEEVVSLGVIVVAAALVGALFTLVYPGRFVSFVVSEACTSLG